MINLNDIDKELRLTKQIAEAADKITFDSRCGIKREFAADLVAGATTNVLNDQLRSGQGMSREWVKTVINVAIVTALEDFQPAPTHTTPSSA